MPDRSSIPAPADVFIGQQIASDISPGVTYRIERLLGEGGTARAYYAIRSGAEGHQPVVLKVILPEIVRASDKTATLVIKKEAVALGRLNERIPRCPYVVRFVDTGIVNVALGPQVLALPWLAIEYVPGGVEGSALDERVVFSVRTTGYAFDPERAARALLALSRGLDEIHAVGVVHRDLKPANVLCCGTGETELYKISDFGIARPFGMGATFGNIAVGTPGYVAPEQVIAATTAIGPHTDVFALAAVSFCILTGEHYFSARNTIESYNEVKAVHRRSLASCPALCPELRERQVALEAIDHAIAKATSFTSEERPRSAKEFADTVLPWLSDVPKSVHVSVRWLEAVKDLGTSPSRLEHEWLLRHPPSPDRIVLGADFNADGHCLAATTNGLEYFDGTRFRPLTEATNFVGRRANNVRPLAPSTWIVLADGARLIEVAREGTTLFAEGPDPSIDFMDIDGDLDDFAVILARGPSQVALLCTRIGKRWLRPFEVTQAAFLSGIARLDDSQWLVTGRDRTGQAWAGIYRPLSIELSPLPIPRVRALLACTSRQNRRLAAAVGSSGCIVNLTPDGITASTVPGSADLSAVALDVAGQLWAGSMGRVYYAAQPNQPLNCVWHEPSCKTPFVRLHAELGHLLALTVDGGIIEGRQSRFSHHG